MKTITGAFLGAVIGGGATAAIMYAKLLVGEAIGLMIANNIANKMGGTVTHIESGFLGYMVFGPMFPTFAIGAGAIVGAFVGANMANNSRSKSRCCGR